MENIVKQTLPDGWRWETLGECCDVMMGQSPKSDTYNTENKGLPFFQGKTEFGKLSPCVKKWCSHPIRIAKKGDVLISIRAPVGPTNLADIDCCIGRGLGALRPGKSVINMWIFLYLRSIESDITALGTGTTFSAISGNTLRQISVPIPPLSQQKRIANKIEKIFARLDKVSECLNRIKQNIIYARNAYLEKFFSSNGVMKTLGDVATVISGGTPSTQNFENFENGDIPWITPADLSRYNEKYISKGKRNITKQGLKTSSARLLPKDTVLFSSRAPIGYVVIAANPLCTNQGFKNFVLQKGISPEYVYWWLKHIKDIAISLGSGTTFLELTKTNAEKLPFLAMPLAEQKQIANKIEKTFARFDKISQKVRDTEKHVKMLKQGMLNKYFMTN